MGSARRPRCFVQRGLTCGRFRPVPLRRHVDHVAEPEHLGGGVVGQGDEVVLHSAEDHDDLGGRHERDGGGGAVGLEGEEVDGEHGRSLQGVVDEGKTNQEE